MDQDNDNQSSSGIKSNENEKPISGVDGFVVPPNPNHIDDNHISDKPVSTPGLSAAGQTVPKKSGKMLKFCLFVFIILFIATAAGLGYYYLKNNKAKTDLSSAKNATATLQQQLSAAQQSSSQQATSLQKTINSQKTYITTLTNTAEQLKTTCSKTCNNITIPTAPATN